jgi:hypothetical protein
MKLISLKSWMLLLVAAAGFSSFAAQAQHVFRPYVGIALTDYSIKVDGNAEPRYANKTAKSDFLATTVGISWITPQRIYADLAISRSGSATHDLWKDATLGGSPVADQDFSYDSEALTVGYVHLLSQGQSISGFGGLRHSKTTLNAPNGATTPAGNIVWSKDIFDSRGVFFGAAWGLPALGGSISLSGALAILGGNWKDDAGFNADANATVGLGLSASYTYRFAQAWAVTADARLQSYGYNFTRPSGTGNVDYNVNERIFALGARVSYQF